MSRDHRLFARLETDIACTALFLTYLPTPLVLLTDRFGIQTVHIAPEAFTVASAEFGDEAQTQVEAPAPKAPAQVEATDLQPAKPTYDPRVRQFREPPPVITSRYQWYIYPGEAV